MAEIGKRQAVPSARPRLRIVLAVSDPVARLAAAQAAIEASQKKREFKDV